MLLENIENFFALGHSLWNSNHLMSPIMWIFTNSVSIWFATWLSIFYLAKIAIFSHPIFLQLKRRISGLVPWLLLGSGVFSAMTAITVMLSLNNGFSMCRSSNDSEIRQPDSWKYLDVLGMAPNLIPFLIFVSSSILLVRSLWKHIRRIQRNGIGVRDLNTQVHLTAIKALASFAILYLSNFLAITLQAVLIWNNMDHTWPWCSTVLGGGLAAGALSANLAAHHHVQLCTDSHGIGLCFASDSMQLATGFKNGSV
ncbi:taste receptor type 2 member 134-like [Paroedura picta]|uniref:taste receptor type 2 member 134-like n=1 Tax=Paroedura picta TaxID=143630 RepID=UPI004055D693